jgi:histidinol dehydrogenase
MSERILRLVSVDDLPPLRRTAVDEATLAEAGGIVEDVRLHGEEGLRQHATRLGDITEGDALFAGRDELDRALAGIDPETRGVLTRTSDRIRRFAEAQRAALSEMKIDIPGGRAGHSIAPVERAGCYAPGGRFPLPSSVLMTAVTARTAGVETVWVASPRPTDETLAAAALAGADGFLRVGGAQAIAALAFGAGAVPACDVVVGPGNRWVTAAKQLVSGHVRIDMLAGPSELVVLADGTADAALVAADLLAQAEHDPDALPILVALDGGLIEEVERELRRQLETLPAAGIARAALGNGFAVLVSTANEAAAVCNRLAPEHLELIVRDEDAVLPLLKHYGALFLGAGSAEVLGDYGAGPNHTLPTGGTARSAGGLSVLDFLRVRTWMRIDDLEAAENLVNDAAALGRIEGLEAHARSAERRQRQ